MVFVALLFALLGIWQFIRGDYPLVALAMVAVILALVWPKLEARFEDKSKKSR